MTPFQHTVSTEQELRELIGQPSRLVQNKVIDRLDGHCRTFIYSSPLLFLSTADATGYCDASPRGDQPGFVQVLDDSHLLIPDRPGNRRVDSLRNVLSNAHVGLVFLIPGLDVRIPTKLTTDSSHLRPLRKECREDDSLPGRYDRRNPEFPRDD